MGYKHPEILKSNPYYDDFDDTKKFLRVLFKPGYAVQARELTQLQTLLQNQIAKFGSHIFKDGSQVFGGGVSLGSAEFVRANISFATSGSIQNVTELKNTILTQVTSEITARAKIIDILAPTSTDNNYVLVLQYLTGDKFVSNGYISVENINTSTTIFYPSSVTSGAAVTGVCQTISVDSGIFYVDGFFVNNDPQITTLHVIRDNIRKFRDPILTEEGVTNRIGFEIVRTTVTAETDSTLVDPARGFYNYNAPGADRYQIQLSLTTQEFDPASVEPGEFVTEDFVELARTVKGVLDYVKKVPTYAELVDTLARRTYDESGNYTVKPFELEVKNHYRDDTYSIFVKVDSNYSSPFYIGDYINTNVNGRKTKIGEIVDFYAYVPTTQEQNATNTSELPTYVFKVKRVANESGVLDYQFFTTSSNENENKVYYSNTDDSINSQYLGITKRVTASRDPDGVYSPEEGGVDDKYVLSVKPGKAYVFGYEFETINNTNIVVDKARLETTVTVNDYNLGSNIGNYFIVEAPLNSSNLNTFNNWDNTIDLDETPYMKFGGRYIRITIPNQAEDKRSAYLKYWSPLVSDQDLNTFRSIAFVTKEDALGTESITGHTNPADTVNYLNLIDFNGEAVTTEGVVDTGFIRPQVTERSETRFIGGGTSQASYPIVNMSNDVESNISRLVFTDPWHGNFQTSYDITSESTTGSTYTTSVYPVKQIKCLDTTNPSSIQVTTGNALRWVPASSTGAGSTSGSALFIHVTGAVTNEGSTNIENAHFNLDDSVVFTDPSTTTNPISYGTSIAYVVRESNTKRTIIKPNGSLGCNGGAECTDEGQGGFFSVGDIVTQNYTRNGVEVQAVGEVLAIGGDFALPTQGNDGVEVYIQSTGVYQFFGVNDAEIGTEGITDLGCIIGPCGVYRPRSSVNLNDPTCGELIRIGFKDTEDYGAYTVNGTVFQYNYIALQEDINGVPSYNTNDLVKGRVISWNENSKELIVLETQGRFEKYNGTVYQLASGTNGQVKYGGRGWDKIRTKYSNDTSSGVNIYDIEKVSGIFIDVSGTVTTNFNETSSSVFAYASSVAKRGESIIQLAVPQIGNYAGEDFATNDVIYQNTGTNGTATGIVLSFTHRDLTNPADESNTVIVIQPTNNVDFIVGPEATGVGKALRSQSNSALILDVSSNATTKTKEIIGCGRIRLLRRQEEDAYQAFFYDIKMDYLPDLSRKYNLNEVSDFYYEQNFANAIINNFEDEDIQLASSTAESDYIFTVHPTRGIDETSTNQFFTYSKVFDSDLNSLLFSLPGSSSIKAVGEMDYRIQQQFNISNTAGANSDFLTDTLTINSSDPYVRFIGGESSVIGKVDSNDLIEHYTLIIDGVIQDLTSSYTVTTNNYSSPTSNSQVSIRKNNGFTWVAANISNVQLICNMNVNPSPSTSSNGVTVKGGIRIKHLKRNTDTSLILKKTKDGSWKANLSKSDIFAIDKITTVSSSADIKHKFNFFNGQTDNLYDFGQVTLKSEYLVNNAPDEVEINVTYRYFLHDKEGPITVDSYIGIDYKDIPYFTSPATGKTVKLDSVIDLRPVKVLSSGKGVIEKKWIPAPASSFDVDYSYYLSKAYKLVITRDLQFKLISGVPAFEPELPADDENAMTIYDIVSEPYVFNRSDVVATMVNNRRYTMKDIIGLDERIQALEQYTVLNSLEKQAEAESIVETVTQLPKVKTSILVDNFSSHAKGDTKNDQYNVSIDPEENLLRPPFKMHSVDLDETNTTLNNLVKTSDNVVLLTYEEAPFITQYSASGVEKINPFNDVAWIGTVKMSPSSDAWFDTTEVPDVRENEEGINDTMEVVVPSAANNNNTGLGMEWSFWKRRWLGKKKNKKNKKGFGKLARRQRIKNRAGIKGTVVKQRTPACDFRPPNTINVGENKTVDKSVIPFIRNRTINAVAEGLKPYTTVYVYFDDVDITAECQIVNNTGSLVYSGGLKTDSKGSVEFSFDIGQRKFKAGEKLLVVTDSASNNADQATTTAEAVYNASGAIEIANENFVSTRKAAKKPSAYSKNISDPVAQTFFVDETQYPQGVFVSSVDLFFANADSTLPVTVELRPTNSGYPATRRDTKVYPFASVTAYPTQIVTSTNPNGSTADTKTRFTFSTPVHLLPGEHSLVVRTNSSEYTLYVAEVGQFLLNSESRITQQAAVGSFFKSQNAGKWQNYENIDLMFALNKCDFSGSTGLSGTVLINDVSDATKDEQIFELYTVNNDEVKFNNTEITYAIRTTTASSSVIQTNKVNITPNVNITLPESNKVSYNGNSIELEIGLSSTDSNISPMFDLDRLVVVGVQNLIENNTILTKTSSNYNGELDPLTPIVANETARCRYITKIIELEKGFESTNVNVTLGANIPADTKIQVFLKQQSAGKDSMFDEEPYVQLTPNKPTYVSPDENTFEDIMYSLPTDLEQPFGKYAIKICLYSGNPVRVPKVKEMRIISVV